MSGSKRLSTAIATGLGEFIGQLETLPESLTLGLMETWADLGAITTWRGRILGLVALFLLFLLPNWAGQPLLADHPNCLTTPTAQPASWSGPTALYIPPAGQPPQLPNQPPGPALSDCSIHSSSLHTSASSSSFLGLHLLPNTTQPARFQPIGDHLTDQPLNKPTT